MGPGIVTLGLKPDEQCSGGHAPLPKAHGVGLPDRWGSAHTSTGIPAHWGGTRRLLLENFTPRATMSSLRPFTGPTQPRSPKVPPKSIHRVQRPILGTLGGPTRPAFQEVQQSRAGCWLWPPGGCPGSFTNGLQFTPTGGPQTKWAKSAASCSFPHRRCSHSCSFTLTPQWATCKGQGT